MLTRSTSRPRLPPTTPPARRALAVPAALFVSILVLLAGGARARAAQVTGFASDRFEPAGAGSEWMSLESLDFGGHLRPSFALVGDWAWKPLVFYTPSGGEIGALVRQQLVAHADAAVVLWNRARVDVGIPFALAQSGSDFLVNGQSYAAPHGGAVGDLRLGVVVRLFGRPHERVTGALGVQLFLPTGQTQAFSGDGGVRAWTRFMVAGDRGPFAWAAQVGLHLRPQDGCGCDLAPGHELTLGASAGWRPAPRILLGPELYMSRAFSSRGAFSQAPPPVEVLLGGHVLIAPEWRASAGIAPGLTDGPGTPAVRIVVGVQYTFLPRPPVAVAAPAWQSPAP